MGRRRTAKRITRDEWNDYIIRANGYLDTALSFSSRIGSYLHPWSDTGLDLDKAEANCIATLDAIHGARANFDLAEPGRNLYAREENRDGGA